MKIALLISFSLSFCICAYYYTLKKKENKITKSTRSLIFVSFLSIGITVFLILSIGIAASSSIDKYLLNPTEQVPIQSNKTENNSMENDEQKKAIDSIKEKIASKKLVDARRFLQIYINQYPTGNFIDEAKQLLAQIEPQIIEQEKQEEENLLPQRRESFKNWSLNVLNNAKDIDKEWSDLDDILEDNNRARVYKNLSITQKNLEILKQRGNALKPPENLSADHFHQLQSAMKTFEMAMFYRIKAIKLAKEYLETRKPSVGAEIYDARAKVKELEDAASYSIGKVKNELGVEY